MTYQCPSDLVYSNLYNSGTRKDIEKRSIVFFSVINGLSCETIKDNPKFRFTGNSNAQEAPIPSPEYRMSHLSDDNKTTTHYFVS